MEIAHPLRFHCLVLETTERCNAKCAMCYQAAGPKGSDIRGDSSLELDVLKRVIDEASQLPELSDRVHVSGGEGFIDLPKMLALFSHARQAGFLEIGATTNAFWALSPRVAQQRCEALGAAGVSYLEVSMDHWHLPYVSPARVRTLLPAARAAGIRVMIRTLSSRAHGIRELFDGFSDHDLAGMEIANSRVMPVGRGAATIDADDVFGGIVEGANCQDVLNLTVSPDGNVFPCCAGADMTTSLSSGNVSTDTLSDIVLRMRTDQMIRHLIHRGPATLVSLVEAAGLRDRLQPKHSSICHLCWDIFKDPEISQALREHFNEVQFEMLTRLVLETSPAA